MTEVLEIKLLTEEEACELAVRAVSLWPCAHGRPQLVMHRENTVFRVRTDNGDAAMRLHRAGYHDQSEISSELAWMAYLKDQGIPVPAPIATRLGDLTASVQTGRHAPRIIDMLTWLDGEPLGKSGVPLPRPAKENVRIFRELGRTMALFHSASDA